MDGAFFPTVRPGGSPKVTARNGRVQCSAQRSKTQPSLAQPSAQSPQDPMYQCTFPAELFALPGGPSGPSGLPTPRSLGGIPDTPPGSVREGGPSNVWRALRLRPGEGDAEAGRHLSTWLATAASHRGGTPNKCPDREPRVTALALGVHGYFRSCPHTVLWIVPPSSSIRPCPLRT